MDKVQTDRMLEAAIKSLLGKDGYELYVANKQKTEDEREKLKEEIAAFLKAVGKEKILEHADVVIEGVFERVLDEIKTYGEAVLVSLKVPHISLEALKGIDAIEKKVKSFEKN